MNDAMLTSIADTVSPTPTTERRASVRQPCSLGGTCRLMLAAPDRAWPARVQDLSVNGMCLWLDRPVDLGTMLAVDLEVVGTRRTLWVRVVRVATVEGGGWRVGGTLLYRLSEPLLRSLLGSHQPAMAKG